MAGSTTMSAAWYNKGVSWMPPCVSLLFGPLGVPPILILKFPCLSNFRTKPSPPSLFVVQGAWPTTPRALAAAELPEIQTLSLWST